MKFTEFIKDRIVIFDGATGTMLQAAGLESGHVPDLWNFERPDVIRDIHLNYLEAGADVISMVTFRAGTVGETEKVIMAAADNCRQAIARYRDDNDDEDRPIFMSLDIGPTGKLIGIDGGMTFDEAYSYFRIQAEAGEKAEVDVILLETFSDVTELKIAVLATIENTTLPVMATVTFEEGGRMLTGADPATAARMFADIGVTAFGANCSLGPRQMLPIVRELAGHTTLPLIVQPNAGMPRLEDGEVIYDVGPFEFAEDMADIVSAGACIVGGCCGTTPEHIIEVADRVSDPDIGLKAGNINSDPLEARYPSVCASAVSLIVDNEKSFVMEEIRLSDENGTGDVIKHAAQTAKKLLKKGSDVVCVHIEKSMHGIADKISEQISMNARLPLAFKCADANALDRAVRHCRGKPAVVIDPDAGAEAAYSAVRTAMKYGTAIIVERDDVDAIRTVQEAGIPARRKIWKDQAGTITSWE